MRKKGLIEELRKYGRRTRPVDPRCGIIHGSVIRRLFINNSYFYPRISQIYSSVHRPKRFDVGTEIRCILEKQSVISESSSQRTAAETTGNNCYYKMITPSTVEKCLSCVESPSHTPWPTVPLTEWDPTMSTPKPTKGIHLKFHRTQLMHNVPSGLTNPRPRNLPIR